MLSWIFSLFSGWVVVDPVSIRSRAGNTTIIASLVENVCAPFAWGVVVDPIVIGTSSGNATVVASFTQDVDAPFAWSVVINPIGIGSRSGYSSIAATYTKYTLNVCTAAALLLPVYLHQEVRDCTWSKRSASCGRNRQVVWKVRGRLCSSSDESLLLSLPHRLGASWRTLRGSLPVPWPIQQ